MDQTSIFGVRIDVREKKETLNRIQQFLCESYSHAVYTPNPEMLVDAYKSQEFKHILNGSDINICDGFGITFVSACSKKIPKIPRYPGSDAMIDICRLAMDMGKSVYLLGTGNMKTLQKAKEQLQKQFPSLRIVGVHPGTYISKRADGLCSISEDENEKIIDDIIDAAPDLLFVAFGHGKQEWWIHTYRKQLPSVQLAMGVGGSIDFIAGRAVRAPKLLRALGVEWLWRLLLQPWRIKRIVTAVLLFPYLFFFKQNKQ